MSSLKVTFKGLTMAFSEQIEEEIKLQEGDDYYYYKSLL